MGMIGILSSGSKAPPNASTLYLGLHVGPNSTNSWTATESTVLQVCPVGGTINTLKVKSSGPPAAGQTAIFTVRQNGAGSALTATMTSAGSTAADTTHSVTVAAGDTLAMEVVTSATAGMVTTSWATKFTATNTNEFPLLYASQTQLGSGATNYVPIQGDAAGDATEANAQSVIPAAGTISNLYVLLDTIALIGTVVVTVYVNGVSTAITATVAIGGTTANNITNSVSISAGDTISYQVVNNGGVPRISVGMKWAPTTNGQSIFTIAALQSQVQAITGYNTLGCGSASWNVSETTNYACGIASFVAKNMYLKVTGIASGQTYTAFWRNNFANSIITKVITGTASTGNDTTHTVTLADFDRFDFQAATSGTSGTVRATVGYVLFLTQPVIQNPKSLSALGVG